MVNLNWWSNFINSFFYLALLCAVNAFMTLCCEYDWHQSDLLLLLALVFLMYSLFAGLRHPLTFRLGYTFWLFWHTLPVEFGNKTETWRENSIKVYAPFKIWIFSINFGNIGQEIRRCYRVNIVSGTSKSDRILPIYIEIRRYLKPWFYGWKHSPDIWNHGLMDRNILQKIYRITCVLLVPFHIVIHISCWYMLDVIDKMTLNSAYKILSVSGLISQV